MKWIRITLIFCFAAFIAALGIFGFWLWSLNQKISIGLQSKQLLKPTVFWSSAFEVSRRTIHSPQDLINELLRRNYRERNETQSLLAGDFQKLNADLCRNSLRTNTEFDASTIDSCISWQPTNQFDPWVKSESRKWAIFSASELLALYQDDWIDKVFLESTKVAQYLGKQPILQDWRDLGEFPPSCLNAVLAIEDNQFLTHQGVSLVSILRAAISNLTGIGPKQGGSTITQQTVKNYFLTAERTLKRKFIEFFMSILFELQSSKDQILETYLNIIYMGQSGPFQIRGFPQAAQHYFQKSIGDLSLNECATLAAVLNSPGLYDPYRKPEAAEKRRNLVLKKMAEMKYISPTQLNSSTQEKLILQKEISISDTVPYYMDSTLNELENLGLDSEGRDIFTYLNIEKQKIAQDILTQKIALTEKSNPKIAKFREQGKTLEAAFVSVDPYSGGIEALVGGRGYRTSPFNRAYSAKRQIGSLFKPFVYLAAFEADSNKWNPDSSIDDVSFTWKYEGQSWKPQNYDKKDHGLVTLKQALANSFNISTARLAQEIGLSPIVDLVQQSLPSAKIPKVPSIVLGSLELSPVEVAQIYTWMATAKKSNSLHTVRAIKDEHQTTAIISPDYQIRSVSEPEVALTYLWTLLAETTLTGTAKSISASLPTEIRAYGKTGTTSEYKDAWFAGYTEITKATGDKLLQNVSVSWIGYDDNTSSGLTGASAPLQMWIDFTTKTQKPQNP